MSAKRFKCPTGFRQKPPKSRNCVSNRKKLFHRNYIGQMQPKGKRYPKRSRKNSKKTCIRSNKSDSKSY